MLVERPSDAANLNAFVASGGAQGGPSRTGIRAGRADRLTAGEVGFKADWVKVNFTGEGIPLNPVFGGTPKTTRRTRVLPQKSERIQVNPIKAKQVQLVPTKILTGDGAKLESLNPERVKCFAGFCRLLLSHRVAAN